MKKRPVILGHRGYKARFPENTLLSFAKSGDFGADGFECDIQKISDGCFIVFHDTATERMTGYIGDIREMSMPEIRQLRVDGEMIPTLEETLAESHYSYVNIELKEDTIDNNDVQKIIKILDKYTMHSNVLISSFKHDLLKDFKRAGFHTGMLVGWEYRKKGILGLVKDILKIRPKYINIPVSVMGFFSYGVIYLFVKLLKLFGFKFLWWTVNSYRDFRKIRNLADVIITDEVENIVLYCADAKN